MSPIADNLIRVQSRIEAAAKASGRDPASVTLVAVSKTRTVAEIHEAYKAGQAVFGENYAQELAAKAAALADLEIGWHFTGHLQKNKAKYVAPVASCVETIDSVDLADALNHRAAQRMRCLIEVNVGGEESKSGIEPDGVTALAREIMKFPNLDFRGLMIIPPYDPDPEKSRPYFRKIKRIFDETNRALAPFVMTELSMGMSHDFEVAIEEGATIIRVGTAIFGERAASG